MKQLTGLLLTLSLSAGLLGAQVQQQDAKSLRDGGKVENASERGKVSRADRQAQRRAKMAERRAETEKRRKAAAERRQAVQFRRFQLPGEQLEKNVRKLTTELTWHDSLQAAQRVAKQTGKPILWIHALGELDGFL